MTAVFISSDNKAKDIAPIFSLLSRTARVSAFFESFTCIIDSAEYVLLPLKNEPTKNDADCAAIVFSDSRALDMLPAGCAVLCFCDKAAARCSGQGRQIISCGMHNKDTVTLSSTEKGKPVLSVQRRLTSFSGEAIEVGDFPLMTDEQDCRALMAAAVLLLLNGKELEQNSFSDQSSTTEPVPFST